MLDSFTSEYCDGSPPEPNDCEVGYWDHTNINDGEYAVGYNATAFGASWAADDVGCGTTPEQFVFSFAGGAAATITRLVIQNYGDEGGGEGPFYSNHIIVEGEPVGGGAFFPILDVDIAENEDVTTFDLTSMGGAVDVQRLRLSLTSSMAANYCEFGEFEAWGQLQ